MYKDVIEFIRETFGEKERDIPLHAPCFVGNEKKYLEECIDSTFVSSVGPLSIALKKWWLSIQEPSER